MAPPTRIPGSVGKHGGAATRGPTGTGPSHPLAPDTAAKELQGIALDLVQLAFDIAGFVDPTPVSDGAGALLALARGQWLNAALSGISMVPYIGDLAKAGKLPKYLKTVEKAFELADKSAAAAKALVPGMAKLERALEMIPRGASVQIDNIRLLVQNFLAKNRAARIAIDLLPDISGHFRFPPLYTVTKLVTRDGKKVPQKFQVKEAGGRLGVPGKVKSHRGDSETMQERVSKGSGDDAGHLIGDQFGARPGGANLSKTDAPLRTENLSRQNWKQNEGGGTFHALEERWAEKLKAGTGVEVVHVRDYFPEGEIRPQWREVQWKEIHPDGATSVHRLDFMNTHTPDAPHRAGSRTKQKVEPTITDDDPVAPVIDIFTRERLE